MNTVILTKVKLKSLNNVDLPTKSSNNLSCDAIRLVPVYVCDESNDEILETIFSREELKNDEFIL